MSTAASTQPSFDWNLITRWLVATVIGWAFGLFFCDLLKAFLYELCNFETDGAVIGTCIGLAQIAMMNGYIRRKVWWVCSTAVAYAVGKAIGDYFAYQIPGFFGMALEGAIIGICVGFGQMGFLREKLLTFEWWPIVNLVAWTVGWCIIMPATAGEIEHPLSAYAISALGAAAAALISGVFLAYYYGKTETPRSAAIDDWID